MGESWGHTLQPLDAEGQATVNAWHHGECAIGKCKEPARWLGTYRYVTGRAGRVGWARRFMCDGHAEKFRAKNEPAMLEGRAGETRLRAPLARAIAAALPQPSGDQGAGDD